MLLNPRAPLLSCLRYSLPQAPGTDVGKRTELEVSPSLAVWASHTYS